MTDNEVLYSITDAGISGTIVIKFSKDVKKIMLTEILKEKFKNEVDSLELERDYCEQEFNLIKDSLDFDLTKELLKINSLYKRNSIILDSLYKEANTVRPADGYVFKIRQQIEKYDLERIDLGSQYQKLEARDTDILNQNLKNPRLLHYKTKWNTNDSFDNL